MDGTTTGALARSLGTSVPRVHRAIRDLGLSPARTEGGQLRLSGEEADLVRSRLGSIVRLPGFRREELVTLAALSRRPFGLRSARAVARAASISPTAAAAALTRLERDGYVIQLDRYVVEGSVRQVKEWQVAFLTPQWRRIAGAIAQIELPRVPTWGERPIHLPRRFGHLFWDVPHPERIDLRLKGATVAARILLGNDHRAQAWAAAVLSPEDLRGGAAFRGVSPQVRAMAENLARR